MTRNQLLVGLCGWMLAAALPVAAQQVEIETYTLPNGLNVILHEDHTLPQVVVNTWFAVGGKDEQPGRSGFAHLFEHLMFMGTERVPGNSFDVIMESGGGANNASTSVDRTNYFSWGPSSLLPTLLWLDADRLEGLGKAMNQEKLDLQRDVVRNERRERTENTPYGVSRVLIPKSMYPVGHPYHEPVIGSHEDLQAATLDDVVGFFDAYYVPGNASLVVAGDFDPETAKELIAKTFGALEAKPLPTHLSAEPVVFDNEVRRMAVDRVQFPRLYLVWHSPAAYKPGDTEMSLLASILGDGASSRLYKRLVIDERVARNVAVFQYSSQLGSELRVVVTGNAGADLEQIKRVVLAEIASVQQDGPTEAEVQRVKALEEAALLRQMEDLRMRADMLNRYRHYLGKPDSFADELDRIAAVTAEDIRRWASDVLGEGRLDLRILPEGASIEGADLDQRPADLADPEYSPETATTFKLANGVPVHVVSRQGTGLFAGALVVDGGERLVESDQAGLVSLAARMLTAGAGGKDAAGYADAVASLGAEIDASSNWHALSVEVSGLTSRFDPTLDLFADAVLRPNLLPEDFAREKDLTLASIRSRVERPTTTAVVSAFIQTFGRTDPRGRPAAGFEETVTPLTLDHVKELLPQALDPARAQLVFAGDVEPEGLRAALEARFKDWRSSGSDPRALPEPLVSAAQGKLVLIDRPDAPQTFLYMIRPIPAAADITQRVTRRVINTLYGDSFTSRLNQNIREEHGFSYGARSVITQLGNQSMLFAYSSVQSSVTGAALAEFKKEFDGLASGDVTPDELTKATKTVRLELVRAGETTADVASGLEQLVQEDRPLDSISRALDALPGVGLDMVNNEARSGLFDWDSLVVVMVGPAAEVLPQLEEAGFAAPMMADELGTPLQQ